MSIPSTALLFRRKVKRGRTANIPARTIETTTAFVANDLGLDEPITPDRNGDEPLTLEETIDSGSPTPEALTAKDEGRAVVRDLMETHLSPKQFRVLTAQLGFNELRFRWLRVMLLASQGRPRCAGQPRRLRTVGRAS